MLLILPTALSCNEIKQQYSDGFDRDYQVNDSILAAENIVITDSIIIPSAFEKELVYDFNGDNNLDSLFLGANVALDDQGNPLWDDGQNWFVNIKILDSLHFIYSKSIQLGKVNVYFDEVENEIYVVEDGPHQSEAFRLDATNNFKPLEIAEIPDTEDMILLSLD